MWRAVTAQAEQTADDRERRQVWGSPVALRRSCQLHKQQQSYQNNQEHEKEYKQGHVDDTDVEIWFSVQIVIFI